MASKRRDSVLSIRITDDELAKLRAKATARGITVSELLRRSALTEVNYTPYPFVPTVTFNTSRSVIFGEMLQTLCRSGTITLSD